ncbi:MAG: ABC transporter permease [Anaerolineae bacterium]|nr:ABC transporter permease [Anaerolineae bacterium]
MKRVAGLLGLLLLWEIAARALGSPFLPPVTRVIPALWRMALSGEAGKHASVSLQTILLGFGWAAGVGLIAGIGMAESTALRQLLTPVIDAMRPVAALTLFPLIILVLGLGQASKIFVIFWTAWPPVLLNTVLALRDVDASAVEAARLDGAGQLALLSRVKFPLALPIIMTGLRVAMSGGWISLVAAEMLGASAGLGYSILAYSQTFRFPEMYAVIFIIALLGLALNSGLALIQSVLKKIYS